MPPLVRRWSALTRRLEGLEWLVLLVVRVAVGWVFFRSGLGKLQNLDGVIEFFGSLGIPAPQLQAPFIAGLECVGGLGLLVGALTRPFAALLSATMVVAIATAKWAEVGSFDDLLGLVETHYLVLLVVLVVFGAGKASVDALVAKRFVKA